MQRCVLLMITFAIAYPCTAATTTWEGFDLKNCKHWKMTPDDFEGRGENFRKANELADKLNSGDKDNHWLVVQGGALFEDGDDLYGVCSFGSSWSVITCAEGVNFPLSGATYKQVSDKTILSSFRCIRGCDGTSVQMIHDMGYETEPDDVNVEHSQLQAKFETSCRETEKKKKFFDEYNKRTNARR